MNDWTPIRIIANAVKAVASKVTTKTAGVKPQTIKAKVLTPVVTAHPPAKGLKVTIEGTGAPYVFSGEKGKYIEDAAVLADLVSFFLSSEKVDQAALIETVSFDLATAKVDIVAINEVVTLLLSIQRSLTDLVQQSDTVTLSAVKGVADSTASSDSIDVSVSKGLVDQATNAQVFQYALGMALAEAVSVTDDFLGVANIDDDQYMTFNKVVSEIAETVEDIVAAWVAIRETFDIVSLQDGVILSTNKGAKDNLTLGETVRIEQSKVIYETAAVVFTVAKTLSKALSDSVGYVEDFNIGRPSDVVSEDSATFSETFAFVMGYNRVIAETASVGEQVKVSATKVLSDSVSDIEELLFDLDKGFSDSLSVNETLLTSLSMVRSLSETFSANEEVLLTTSKGFVEALELLDILRMSATKTLQESISDTEQLSVSLSKFLNESVSKSDSGTIFHQSYFSADYNASQYVGTSTSF